MKRVASRPGRVPRDAPQAPRLGRLARLLGPLRVDGVFWYRLHRFGATRVPDVLVAPILGAFTIGFTVALIRIRRAIDRNLRPVLGPTGLAGRWRRAFRTFHAFAWCVTERYEWLGRGRGAECATVEIENPEAWNAVTGTGRGFVMLTAHIGNWEFGSALPATREGRRVHLVREEEADPKAQEFVRRLVTEAAGEGYVTHFARDDPFLGVALLEALRDGDVVALQGDRPRAGGAIVETRVFERPFAVPVGPYALARAAGVPVLPVFMFREGRRRYAIAFHDPIEVDPALPRRRALAEAAGAFASALEGAIRRAPEQWFCFREVWPEGDQPRST